jgi:hypothetical protein
VLLRLKDGDGFSIFIAARGKSYLGKEEGENKGDSLNSKEQNKQIEIAGDLWSGEQSFTNSLILLLELFGVAYLVDKQVQYKVDGKNLCVYFTRALQYTCRFRIASLLM